MNSIGQADYPFLSDDVIADAKAPEYQMVINGNRFPTAPVRGFAESTYRMNVGLGFCGQTSHSLPLGEASFATDNYMIIESFEKINGSELSGYNIRGGSQLNIHLKNMVIPNMLQTDKISKIFVLCQYSGLIELSAQGVVILE